MSVIMQEKSPPKMGRIFSNKPNKQITGFQDCLITGELQDGFCNCGLPHGVEVLVDGILPPKTMDVFGR